MKIRNIVLASVLATTAAGAFAQAKEQFFPSLVFRTGDGKNCSLACAKAPAAVVAMTLARTMLRIFIKVS